MAKKRPVLDCVTHAWWIFRPLVAGVEFTHPFHVPRTGPIVPMCAASNYMDQKFVEMVTNLEKFLDI